MPLPVGSGAGVSWGRTTGVKRRGYVVGKGSRVSISRALSLRIACHRSQSLCSPSQKSAGIPSTRASLSAVSGVTDRRPLMTSLRRGKDTPRRSAKAVWVIPRGSMNSARSISPGCVGGRSVGSRRSVVIDDFDFVGISILPSKTNSVLFVDSYAVLPRSIAPKSLETIPGWILMPRLNEKHPS